VSLDFFVAKTRERMTEDEFVHLGKAERYQQVGELAERLTKLGVEVRYEYDHDPESARSGEDPGEKIIYAWVPRWVRVFIEASDEHAERFLRNGASVRLGPKTRCLLRGLLASPDAQRALLSSFDAGGREAARAYAFDGGVEPHQPPGDDRRHGT
jgi:hypothetical protein